MNELSRHIEILLLDNDCVIVPGLGGFVAHYLASEYVEEEGMFCPPQRTLGFNSQLKMNDSLLVQSYIDAYDLSYPEALRRMEGEIEEVKQTINVEGSYEFHGIGVINKTSDGRYNFEPCAAGLLTPRLYALGSYMFCPKKDEEEATDLVTPTIEFEKVEEPATQNVAVEAAAEEAVCNDVEVESVENEDGLFDDTIRIKIKTLRKVVTLSAVLALMVLVSLPAGKGSGNVIKSSMVDTELINDFVVNNSLYKKVVNIGAEKDSASERMTADVVVEEKAKSEETVKEAESESYYTIILASKVSRSGADDLVASLGKAGMKDGGINEDGGMRKVTYGKYSTEKEAQDALHKLRKKDDRFDGTWVQKINR